MIELSCEQIYDAITLALHDGFSKNVYGGNIEQGLVEDCFNVIPITVVSSGEMGERRKTTVAFDIVYYPTESGGIEACLTIASGLPSAITLVTAPNGAKIHSMVHDIQIVDSVLHCTVKFTYISKTIVTPDTPIDDSDELMQILKYSYEENEYV